MGSSSAPPVPASPEFLAAFRAAAGPEGSMSFAHFMRLALYHPEVGYYRRSGTRVGLEAGSDFYTASDSGPIFGELISAAATALLAGRNPREYQFVEIGAEPNRSVLAGVSHPFATVQTLRLGDPQVIKGNCVVFSNELFDAQPCVRTVCRDGHWFEIGVRLEGESLAEVEWPYPAGESAPHGYHFDRPLAAVQLLDQIVSQPWSGLFLAFDYGKSLRELLEQTPAGTARAYHRHVQSNDLLSRPGQQDLTCHVCWDWLIDGLRAHGFAQPGLDFQESFLVRHAGPVIAATSSAEAGRLSRRKLALMQLLHPAQMGQKFQVLHALR